MEIFRTANKETGFLNGQFLLAMPGMDDSRFARSVIYVCAHSEKGAMGLIINRPQEMEFSEILVQLGVLDEHQAIMLPDCTRDFIVRNGGPVEMRRGFVLHSDDYLTDSTMPVSEEICLTGTVDILRAISGGRGPRCALMTLGYSGWASGQLENEIANNGWLTCRAPQDLLFDTDLESKYDRLLAYMGVDPSRLATVAGHA
ncbi:YqgE/AlgH family protein [Phyllobacterium sp. TAF24]|jgi:putative transcriptional regulator|uniref:YqgE/AlgH family protein n=1 Tax=unclassified Phyllobacterium TaxID=2638441 RepID=UPI000890F6F0|nr:YqgE/AlgH family protein [Phyllobacterium sp. OV277]SDP12759.1 putative transcriptional regulator [Phyllobacterium sp. OV277]